MRRTAGAVLGLGLLGALALSPTPGGLARASAAPANVRGASSSADAPKIGTITGRTPLASDSGSKPDYVAWAAVRRAFGLPSDKSYLESIAAREDTSMTALGVPLTDSETADIEGRDSLNTVVGRIHDLAHSSPAFAGVSIDQAAGGVVDIALADSSSDIAQSTVAKTLLALVPTGIKSEITHLPYAERLIDDADASIVNDLTAGTLESYGVLSVFEEDHNLVVTVAPDAVPSAEKNLASLYNMPFVKIERNAGVDFQTGRNHTSGPVYGGEWISDNTVGNGGSQCTAGFAHALNSSGSRA